jgi:hypothetical protein
MAQPKARPPFFVLFGNAVETIPESYKRYNGLRETFGLIGGRSACRCARAARILTPPRNGAASHDGQKRTQGRRLGL